MNNKVITLFFLLLSVLITPESSSAASCNSESMNNTCVQIFVNGKTGQALANMVVYLEPLDGQILTRSSKEVVVAQLGKSFTPYLSVSQVNSKVSFVNQDDITHHIYSVDSNNKFSFRIRAGQTNASETFGHVADVAMGCNIHDWMSGYLLIVNTPYFGKTDTQGQVSFNIAQQGKYNVVIWHPQLKNDNNRLSKTASIIANSTFTFTLKNEITTPTTQENEDDFDFLSDY
ncbi:MAG: hypothetical protein JKY81_10905 [Colwellia sp.]|nr:hypothetical protein [Colwellia sp.]